VKDAFYGLLLGFLGLFSIRSLADEPRDPTRPPLVSVRTPMVHEHAPILSAIIGPPSSRVAIFNGQLVRAGSHSGEFFIEAVLEDGIRYRHAGATRELHLAAGLISMKKPSVAAAPLPAGAP